MSGIPKLVQGGKKVGRPKGLIYGVGVDDTDYKKEIRIKVGGKSKIVWFCKIFSRWKNMLRRCYKNYNSDWITYNEVTVCGDWLLFSNYKKWYDSQEKPDCEFDVDKDILFGHLKVYSPESCVIVPSRVNGALVFSCKGLAGANFETKRNKWQAACGDKRLGRYDTEMAAHQVWQAEKVKQLYELIDWYKTTNACNADVVRRMVEITIKVENDLELGLPTKSLKVIK